MFKVLKRKTNTKKPCQQRLLYPQKISFKVQDRINNFPDLRNVKEFITRRPAYFASQEI